MRITLTFSVLHRSPLRILTPYMLHIMAAANRDVISAELADLNSAEPAVPPTLLEGKPSLTDGRTDLAMELWGNRELDGLRLRYVLARWCEVR
jgi:hypothetical protein